MSEELEKVRDLEFYLSDHSYNIQIHGSLEIAGITKQVEFFKLFYDLLRLIENGQTLTAISQINSFNSGGFELFVVYLLRERLRNDNDQPDGPPNIINAALHLLDKEYERLAALYPPDPFLSRSVSFDQSARAAVGIHEFSKKLVYDMLDKMMKEAEEKRNIELRAVQAERERLEKELLSRIQDAVSAATDKSKRNPEFTTTRQTLAIAYLLKHLGIKNVTKKDQADFVQFLIGKTHKDIYDTLSDPTLLNERNGTTAVFLRDWFEKLGLTEIVKDIESAATSIKKK